MKKLCFSILAFLFVGGLAAQNQTIELIENYFGEGGAIELFEENASVHTVLQPDIDGRGGYLLVRNGQGGFDGFEVDGRHQSNQAQVSITGTSSSFFNTFNTGNDAVVLPNNAISASEIMNEAGLASSLNTGMPALPSGSLGTLTSRTITVPSDGYVLALASGQLNINHTNGTDSRVTFGISENNMSLPLNMDIEVAVDDAASSGFYFHASCVQGVFDVTAGSHTFYFLGELSSGTGSASMNETSLTLVFIPTSYGMVDSSLDGPSGDDAVSKSMNDDAGALMSDADLKKEWVESVEHNQARMKAEIDDLKKLIEKMESEDDLNGNKPE